MSKAVANVEKARGIMNYIQAKSKNIEELLPKYLTPERMFRIASLALTKQPLLMQCTPQSFVIAMMDAARMGLEPNGVDGALVPYGNTVQFQPMFRGLVKQAIRCGAATKVESVLVHENDKFRMWRDPDLHIDHVPALEDEGEVIGAYAYAKLPDGSLQVEYMNRRQLDHIKNKSKAKNDGPWKTDEEEMLRKTPVKRLMKYLNLSDELEYAVAADNAMEVGSRMAVPFVELDNEPAPEPKKTRTQQIKDRLSEAPGSPTTHDQAPTHTPARGPITQDQIDRLMALAKSKGVLIEAALPDGIGDYMDMDSIEAEEVITRLASI